MEEIPKSQTGDHKTDALIDDANQYMAEKEATLLNANHKLHIDDFDKYFRGLFMGAVPEDHMAKVGQAWLSFAGSSTAGVDIVDSEDNLLITVPALHDTTVIDVSGGNISHAAKVKNLESANMPGLADQNFEIALADYVEFEVGDAQAPSEELTPWKKFDLWLNGEADEEVSEVDKTFDRRSMYE